MLDIILRKQRKAIEKDNTEDKQQSFYLFHNANNDTIENWLAFYIKAMQTYIKIPRLLYMCLKNEIITIVFI